MKHQNRSSKQLEVNEIDSVASGDAYALSSRTSKRPMRRMATATALSILAIAKLTNDIPIAQAFTASCPSSQICSQFQSQSRSHHYQLARFTDSYVFPSFPSETSTSLYSKKKDSGSRFGVRRRVRSVLERAKNRTGIRNNSDKHYENNNDVIDKKSTAIGKTNASTNDTKRTAVTSPETSKESDLKTPTSKDIPEPETSHVDEIESSSSEVLNENIDSPPTPSEVVKIEEKETTVEVASKTSVGIDPRSSVNVIAEAASIGALGDMELEYKSEETQKTKQKKSKPASTYSAKEVEPSPGDDLVPSKKLTEMDALKGDVSAAFSMPPPPLPFTLPELTTEQKTMLQNGERVQYQSDMGREGSGFVVMDVKAPAAVVWECLLDFYSYPQTIPTVRDVQMFTNTHMNSDYYSEAAIEKKEYQDGTLATLKHGIPSVTRAAFTLSKFRLKIAAIHKYRPHPLGDYMVFTLDPACTNLVLKNAKGVWHTQTNPDGRGEEYTRVWLLCELRVSPLLPQWITDYAAKRAMPRATTWVKPTVEAAADLWFKGLKD